jgi:hypothetical protein
VTAYNLGRCPKVNAVIYVPGETLYEKDLGYKIVKRSRKNKIERKNTYKY